MKKITRSTFAAVLGALALGLAATASHAAVVFDNITAAERGVAGAGVTATSSTPNTFMGDAYVLAAGTTAITGFDLFPVNTTAATTFTNLKLNIYVWGTVNTGTVSAAAPAFSSLLGSYSFTSGTASFANTGYFSFAGDGDTTPGLALSNPLALTDALIGLSFNIQGSTNGGASYANANGLTSLISYGVAPTVGSQMFNGYYRNASSETDGNFTTAPRSLGLTHQSLAVRIYGNVSAQEVPEPGSLALLGLGLAGLALTRRRKSV